MKQESEDIYGHRAYYAKVEEARIKVRDDELRQISLKRERSEGFWNGIGGCFVITTAAVVIMYVVRLFA
jgi:hypothetical protein